MAASKRTRRDWRQAVMDDLSELDPRVCFPQLVADLKMIDQRIGRAP
jgi:hypothetical protein